MISNVLAQALIGKTPGEREIERLEQERLRNVLAQMPEEREWLRESRGREREKWGTERETEAATKRLLPITEQLKKMETLTSFQDQIGMIVENIPWDGYEEYINFWDPVINKAMPGMPKPPSKAEIIAEGKKNLSPERIAGKSDDDIGRMWLEENRDIRAKKKLERAGKLQPEKAETDIDKMARTLYGVAYRQLNPEQQAKVDAKLSTGEVKGQSDLGKLSIDLFGKNYSQLNPEQKTEVDKRMERAGAGKPTETIRTFETVTGIDQNKRGTPEYKEAYHQWQQDLKDDKTVLSSETVDKLSTFQTIHQTLASVTAKADKLKDKFGPMSGRWEKLKVKFKEDPESATVQRELKSLIQIAYGLSGKQISEREMVILREALLPQLEEPYGNFLASLNFASNWAARSHNNLLSGYQNAGYRVKSFEPLPESGTKKTGAPVTEGQRQVAFDKLKATGKWSDQQINAYLDKKGIK